ncbi:UNVERIFIED_CONTAM: hypothetical protein FKN15_002488 [Acipenser sinensis]
MFSAWITALIAGVSTLAVQKLFFPYFWMDLKYLTKAISYGIKIEIYKKTAKVVTVLDRFMQQAQKIPNKPFIIYEDNAFTYQDVDKRSNKVAQVFFKQGVLKKGDTVALLMSNEPDFINVWFGLCKLGCAVASVDENESPIAWQFLLYFLHSFLHHSILTPTTDETIDKGSLEMY